MTLKNRIDKRINIIYKLLQNNRNIFISDDNINSFINILIKNKLTTEFPKYDNINGKNSNISTTINEIYNYLIKNNNTNKYIINYIKNYTPNRYTGKGEVLLSIFFDDVDIVKPNEHYDIKTNNGNYEVKCYKDKIFNSSNNGIRLGVEANLTNFITYTHIKSIIGEIQNILHENEYIKNLLNESIIIDNIGFIDSIKKLCYYNPKNNKKYNIITGFEHGEIARSLRMQLIELFKYLNKVLYLYENNINNRLTGKISIGLDKYLLENPIDNNNGIITYDKKINVNDINNIPFTYHIKTLMKLVKEYDIQHLCSNWIHEMINSLNNSFSNHPMILINESNIINDNYELCLGVYTKFDIANISQSAAKVIPQIN